MVMQLHSAYDWLDPIDRLEKNAAARADYSRFGADRPAAGDKPAVQDLDALRARLADADAAGTELTALRDEARSGRARVAICSATRGHLRPDVTVENRGACYPTVRARRPTVAELAAYHQERAASDAAPSTTRWALPAGGAHIADEYFRARANQSEAHGALNERAMRLERFVDEVLAQVAEKQAG